MLPSSNTLYRLPTWWFPYSRWHILGFFTIDEWMEDGLPWLCTVQKSKGNIRFAFWQGKWVIMAGHDYDQELLDRWAEFMILFHG